MDYIKSIYFNDEGEGITIKFKKRIGLILTLLLMFNFLNNSTISAKNLENNLLVSGTNGGFKAKAVKDNTKELTNQYEAKNKFGYANYITSAFDFHIFSKKATINAHTNGNIATKDLSTNRQGFGTNQSTDLKLTEENYFMKSVDGVSNIASDGNIVIGNKVPVAFEDNNNSLNIGTNGNKLTKDQSLRVYQEDKESISYIDIDQEFENLKTISNLLSSNKTSDGVTLSEPNGENQTITVDGSIGNSNNYYLNIPANKISDGNNKRVLNISIPDNKTLIINVDMANANINSLEKLVTKINNHSNSEGVVEHDNNILWNLYDSLGANGLFTTGAEYANVGTSDYFMGTILAPNANIQYGAVNGSIIANETKQNGQESHKWDFTGHKKEASTVIEATKTLTGKDLTSGMFSFELLDKDNKVLQTVKNDANGKIQFKAINYNKTGSYNYKIKEVKGALEGITYDENIFDVTVNITENEKGNLVAVASYPENGVVFTNKYEPKVISTEVYLEATKTLTGKELSPEMFSFELLDKDNKVLQTVKNDANGKIQFKDINYNKAGSYNYKIKEVKGALEGITYDEKVFDVTVIVTDDEEGKLVAIVNYPEEGIVFTNKYEPKVMPTDVYLEATKTLTGKDLTSGMFSFNLLDDNGKIIENVKNDGDGKIKFNTLNFDKIGTYIYKIVEVKGDLPGVTYDSQAVDVVITVTDNGEGKLKAEVKYPNKTPEFNNSYKADPASLVIKATKKLIGMDLTSGIFSFQLLGKDGSLLIAKNNSDGTIEFSPITYDSVGNYEYTLKEVKCNLPGIIYDESELKIIVNVEDDGKGKLVANLVDPEVNLVFENKLIKGSLEILKTDAKGGKPLKDVEFTIRDSEGNIVKVGKTDDNGKIVFEDLKYGEYTYQETLAKERYVIDNKEYPFEIKENGVVVKASIINERKPETPNKPETPSKPQAPNKPSKSGSPNTGDNGLAVALIIGSLGVGGLVINNKKKIKEKN